MNAIVTGGSKGIGFATANELATQFGEALKVAICSRNADEVRAAGEALKQAHPGIEVLADVCDVSNQDSVKHFSTSVLDSWGSIDLLVNNAGFGIFRKVEQLSVEEWSRVLDTNLRGVFTMTSSVLPSMLACNSGMIVAVSSLAGKNGFKGGAAYCAAKFAVRGLMQSLYLEVREHGIRVMTVFPGSVETAFFDEPSTGGIRSKGLLQADDVAAAIVNAVRLPATADITELDLRPTFLRPIK